MKWELTKWEVDEVGRFIILYTSSHCYRTVNVLVHQYNLMSGDNKTVWCPCVLKQLSIVSNTRRDSVQGRADSNSP